MLLGILFSPFVVNHVATSRVDEDRNSVNNLGRTWFMQPPSSPTLVSPLPMLESKLEDLVARRHRQYESAFAGPPSERNNVLASPRPDSGRWHAFLSDLFEFDFGFGGEGAAVKEEESKHKESKVETRHPSPSPRIEARSMNSDVVALHESASLSPLVEARIELATETQTFGAAAAWWDIRATGVWRGTKESLLSALSSSPFGAPQTIPETLEDVAKRRPSLLAVSSPSPHLVSERRLPVPLEFGPRALVLEPFVAWNSLEREPNVSVGGGQNVALVLKESVLESSSISASKPSVTLCISERGNQNARCVPDGFAQHVSDFLLVGTVLLLACTARSVLFSWSFGTKKEKKHHPPHTSRVVVPPTPPPNGLVQEV